MKIGESTLDLTTPVVMTIVNVTPDSFFVNSRTMDIEDITHRVSEAAAWGTKLIDVGGYSSRPGAEDIPLEDEISRVMLGVGVIRDKAPNMIVSLDTFRGEVAAKVIKRHGPCIINDVSGGSIDPEIIGVAAKYKVPYVLTHSKGTPKTMQNMTDYEDIVVEMKDFFAENIDNLRSKGVEQIILDPGFGFAKTTPQNFRLLHRLAEFKKFELPMLVGISRKSMIYNILETTPLEALTGTAALHWACLHGGANILRVHDTHAATEVIKLFNYYKNVNG
jgi:dihydropteroate synthase